MEIRIDHLRERPRQLNFAEPIEEFPVLAELVARGAVTFNGEVGISLVASLIGTLVEVEGSVTCSVVLPCSRCLQPVEQHLELPVALAFSRLVTTEAPVDEERELTEDEVGLIVFEGDAIDLRSPIEQELLMSLPQHPLCRNDCDGLCPVCGADLNRGRCGCNPPQFHSGLASLRDFKVSKD